MQELANFVVGLFKDLKLPFRWAAIIMLILVVIASLFIYEQLTGHFYFERLEKEVALLNELQSLSANGITSNPDLLPAYKSVISELNSYESQRFTFPRFSSINFNDPTIWWKALSGAALWIILLIFFVLSQIQTKKFSGSTFGTAAIFLVFVFALGGIGLLIPTIFSPWVNYICFPVFQIALLIWLFRNRISIKPKPS